MVLLRDAGVFNEYLLWGTDIGYAIASRSREGVSGTYSSSFTSPELGRNILFNNRTDVPIQLNLHHLMCQFYTHDATDVYVTDFTTVALLSIRFSRPLSLLWSFSLMALSIFVALSSISDLYVSLSLWFRDIYIGYFECP
jgi:hypothetical protein